MHDTSHVNSWCSIIGCLLSGELANTRLVALTPSASFDKVEAYVCLLISRLFLILLLDCLVRNE
jgi:hypothetical protein